MNASAPARLKRSRASLVGGGATGIGVAVLSTLLLGGPSTQNLVIALVLGGAVATWVRLADL